jgi:V/A-type H+/Na+-transporting ATPase subunit F
MKFLCIGDPDTVAGLRFAGVEGIVVESVAQARAALAAAVAQTDVGVIILPDPFGGQLQREINAVRFSRVQPAIVEIPGPGGASPDRPKLIDLVREAIGVRL